MTGRTCRLLFEGQVSEEIQWKSGLPQGSPLSPILFLLYNSHFLRDVETDTSYGYGRVDNLNLLVWGKDLEETVENAQLLVPGLERWSQTHYTAFETRKLTATIFFPPRKTRPPNPPLIFLDGKTLPYSPSLSMLSCTLDKNLDFRAHQIAVAAQAASCLTAVTLVARAQKGIKP